MKRTILFFFILLTTFFCSNAQTNNNATPSGFRATVHGGYDIRPMYSNNTPFIDYKGGWMAGASINYYWNWIGLGADLDYINNKPKSIYPISNLFDASGAAVSGFSLTEKQVRRVFYGVGPDFKYQRNNRFDAELLLRGGLSTIKGGFTSLTSSTPAYLLNYHAGYNAKNVPAAKAQLQINYFVTPSFGLTAGAYYLRHFKAPELSGTPVTGFTTTGISASYYSLGDNSKQGIYMGMLPSNRIEPCKCDISSIGVFAGIVIRPHKKERACPVCGKVHYPQCCQTCGCNITITARDKYTKEVLANTDVVLTGETGAIVQSGTTNTYGTVVFTNANPGNYVVKGKLYNVDLQNDAVTVIDFEKCKQNGNSIQKEIVYTDENFILKGKVVACNTTTPLGSASVVLLNNAMAEQKITTTNERGEFIFHVLQNASYNIYGKKNSYFSQTETVSTNNFDRNKTLFIKLEVCMEKVDCGNTIILKNILYDLDKYFIRTDAKPELNKLVQFMKDNPAVKVELSSHTDSRASDSYNMTLSQNRADAAVDYIVSQGIERNRLVGKGYGESRLLNKCKDGVPCSEAEHQVNRRTEMKVICPDAK